MKICFCIDVMSSGGAERVASNLCNEFVQMNHEVSLLLISGKTCESFYAINNDVRIIPLLNGEKKSKISFFKKIRKIRHFFRKNEFDVVLSFLPNVNISIWLATIGLSKVCHIVSERNNPHTDPPSKIQRKLKEIAFKNADGVVFQTKDAAKYFRNKLKCKTEIIRNPVNQVVEIDNSLSVNNDIIAVGRLEPQKNFNLLFNAFSIFVKDNPCAKLKIYGEGSLRESLENKINDLKLSNCVSFCGNSKTWIQDNANCAMFINTSLYEGMPNSLLEALVNGIPCIASDCPIGGSKELLDFSNGLIFKNNDMDDLLRQMYILYHNQELITVFRENNRVLARDFDVTEVCKKWIRFFEKVIYDKN